MYIVVMVVVAVRITMMKHDWMLNKTIQRHELLWLMERAIDRCISTINDYREFGVIDSELISDTMLALIQAQNTIEEAHAKELRSFRVADK